MPIATLVNAVVTNSVPQYIIAHWEDRIGYAAGTSSNDTTSLTILTLPGLATDEPSFRQVPNKRFTNGVSYAFELLVFNIASSSTNFTARVFNQNNVFRSNSINEVMVYRNINLSNLDSAFNRFIFRNRDDTLINHAYLHITNSDPINATGIISLEMIYINLQDIPF